MGLAGAGRGFARPTLDFQLGFWVLVWLLFPGHIGLGFLAGGRVEETSKCKISEERIISLNEAHIYGYERKGSGTVGPR